MKVSDGMIAEIKAMALMSSKYGDRIEMRDLEMCAYCKRLRDRHVLERGKRNPHRCWRTKKRFRLHPQLTDAAFVIFKMHGGVIHDADF